MKRSAKVGETIKVVHECRLEWDQLVYPAGSIWKVREVIFPKSGLVFCEGNKYGIYAADYVVLE